MNTKLTYTFSKKPQLLRFLALYCVFVVAGCNAQAQDVAVHVKQPSVKLILEDLCNEATQKDSLRKANQKLENQRIAYKKKADSISSLKSDSIAKILVLNKQIAKRIDSNIRHLQNLLENNQEQLKGGYKMEFKGVQYQLFVHNDTNLHIRLHHKDSSGRAYRSIARVRNDLYKAKQIPYLITNAGMYTPKNDPEGLYVENGNELFPLDKDSSEVLLNFYMHPNGVYYLDREKQPHVCTTSEYLELLKDSTFLPYIATQSGPMLKINGEVHPKFNWGSTSRKIRSGVGVYNGMSVFVITRDYSNFYDFASFFTEVFNCEDALFLDGTISKMYDLRLSYKEQGGNFGPIISISKDIKNK